MVTYIVVLIAGMFIIMESIGIPPRFEVEDYEVFQIVKN
jgi:hypothetical protein